MAHPPDSEREPSLGAMAAALAKTTEVLALEVARPRLVAPDWCPMEWQVARAASAIHGLSGILAGRIRWRGPADWHSFLADQSLQVRLRWPRIETVLSDLGAGAAAQGVPIVALKGVALQALGLYEPGERPMADIDILARETDAAAIERLLGELGYRAAEVTWKHRAYKPRVPSGAESRLGELASMDVKIELHTGIREALPQRVVDLTYAILPKDLRPGLNQYPSLAAALLHVLLHACGAMVFRTARALHLNDISRLCGRMSATDWDEFERLGDSHPVGEKLWWVYPALLLASRYCGGVPGEILERAARRCPRRLRRWYRNRALTDVSLSYPWTSAFPGLEWARTGREAASYAGRRIFPTAETLDLRRDLAVSEARTDGGDWAQTSQWRRILRWMAAPQPRHATLQNLRASLNLPS